MTSAIVVEHGLCRPSGSRVRQALESERRRHQTATDACGSKTTALDQEFTQTLQDSPLDHVFVVLQK
jgi:hypothetical protein